MAVLGQALVGTMRVNAARLDYYQPYVRVTIGGTRVETQILTSSLRISDQLPSGGNTAQKTATLRLQTLGALTASALPGADVKIALGTMTNLIAGGTIVTVDQDYDGLQANTRWDLHVNGYWWLLGRRLVNKSYVGVSITAIVTDVIATFASGFTSTHVQAGLPTHTIACSFRPIVDVLTELATTAGALWFVDDTKNVYFFTAGNDPRVQPATVTASNVLHLVKTDDLLPTRTRIYATVSGTASTLGKAAAAGDTTLALGTAYPFGASGSLVATSPTASGTADAPVINRTDVLTYTGASRGSLVTAPATAAWGAISWIGGGNLVNGAVYSWGYTCVTSNGETTLSPLITSTATNNQAGITVTAPGPLYTVQSVGMPQPLDASTIKINVYRTVANGSQLFFAFSFQTLSFSATAGWPTVLGDTAADSDLGAPPPLVNTATQGQGTTTTTSAHLAGVTSITNIVNCAVFDPGGGWALFGTNVLVQYTGFVATNGFAPAGTLTLVAGGLPSQTKANCTVTALPALTGVPASGTGSVPLLLPAGSAVTPFVQLDDATAQTALAALEGGDGIQEFALADGGAKTSTLASTIGTADLTLWKTKVQTVRLDSRDPYFAAGVTVGVTIGSPTSITLTGLIAHAVAISRFEEPPAAPLFPVRSVEASSVQARVTLDGILTQIGKVVLRTAN